MKLSIYGLLLALLLSPFISFAQTPSGQLGVPSASTDVPKLVRFSGTAMDDEGKPLSGVVGVTFSLYKDQEGGSPLWVETQNVQADATGHYTALLGSASVEGVPLSLFSSGEAQWLGVQVQGQPAQPRVLLVSVPYALKAHEAETLSGKSISDFVLLNKSAAVPTTAGNASAISNGGSGSKLPSAANGPTSFVGTNTTQIVAVTQKGTGAGLSATASTDAAVAGTITGKSNTAVYGLASNTGKGSNAAGVTGVANTQMGPGVQGVTTSAVGFGVQGVVNSSTGGTAVQGLNNATSGVSAGVSGQSASTGNGSAGVVGNESATTGQVYGVFGSTNSTTANAMGVSGYEGAKTGQVYGVSGGTNSPTNFAAGVTGFEGATSGQVYGVTGGTNSSTNGATGVNGYEGSKTGQVFGVFGTTTSATNFAAGVGGAANATTGQVYGVVGVSNSTTNGAAAVNGYEPATTGQVYGVSGSTPSTSGTGVVGNATATSGNTNGVAGLSASPNGSGLTGSNSSSTCCFAAGVYGRSVGGTGVLGSASATSGLNFGVQGITASSAGIGVQAGNTPTGEGVSLAAGTLLVNAYVGKTGKFAVDNSGNGYFAGNLNVTGKLTKGSGSFEIDHPLDPANKYLSHSFVESPDMMNVYNGVVVLDAHGSAWVTLPDYFEALNRDFRYQLTAVGVPGPNLYLAKKVSGNRFKIAGGKPRGEVSWQVTGIRQDAYANAYRIPVEEDKPTAEQGYYLHPEVFGQPPSKSIQAASQKASVPDQLAKVSNP
jgi:trimeric autotransporter adhesin